MDKKNRSQTPLILGVGGASLLLLFSFLIPLVFVCGSICPNFINISLIPFLNLWHTNISYIPFLIFGIIAVIGTVIEHDLKLRKLGLSLNILLGIIVLAYGLYTFFDLLWQSFWWGIESISLYGPIPDYPGGLPLIVPIFASVFLLALGISSYMEAKRLGITVSELREREKAKELGVTVEQLRAEKEQLRAAKLEKKRRTRWIGDLIFFIVLLLVALLLIFLLLYQR